MPPKGKGKAAPSDAVGAGYFTLYGATSVTSGAFSNYFDSHIPTTAAIPPTPTSTCMPYNPLTEKMRIRNAGGEKAAAHSQQQIQAAAEATALEASQVSKATPVGKASSVVKAAKAGRLVEEQSQLKSSPTSLFPSQKQPPLVNPYRAAVQAMSAPKATHTTMLANMPLADALLHLRPENKLMECIRVGSAASSSLLVAAGGGAYNLADDCPVMKSIVCEEGTISTTNNNISAASNSMVRFNKGSNENLLGDESGNAAPIIATGRIPFLEAGEGLPVADENGGCVIVPSSLPQQQQQQQGSSSATTSGVLHPKIANDEETASVVDLLRSFSGNQVDESGLSQLMVTAGWSATRVAMGQESHLQPDVTASLSTTANHHNDSPGGGDLLGQSVRSLTISRPVTSSHTAADTAAFLPPRPQSTGKKPADPTLSKAAAAAAAAVVDPLIALQQQFGRFTGIAASMKGYSFDRTLHCNDATNIAVTDGTVHQQGAGNLASWPTMTMCPPELATSNSQASSHVVHNIATSPSRTFAMYITRPRDPSAAASQGIAEEGPELHAIGLLDGEAEILSIPVRAQNQLQERPRLFRQLIPKSNSFRSVLTGSAPSKAMQYILKQTSTLSGGGETEVEDADSGESPQREMLLHESTIIGVAAGSSHCLVLVYDRPTRQTYCFGRGVMSNCGGALGQPSSSSAGSAPTPSASTPNDSGAAGGSNLSNSAGVGAGSGHRMSNGSGGADDLLQVSAVIKGRSKIFVNRGGGASGGSPSSNSHQQEASFRSRNANTSFWGASVGQKGSSSGSASSATTLLSFMEFAPIDAFCSNGVYAVFASKQATFAATREGLFALGTIKLSGPSSHVFITPKLVLPLSASECVVNVSVTENQAFVLLDTGDLKAFDSAQGRFTSIEVVESSSVANNNTCAASSLSSSSAHATTAAGAAIQAALTNKSLSSILHRSSNQQVSSDEANENDSVTPPVVMPAHQFHVYPSVPLLEDFYSLHPTAPPTTNTSSSSPLDTTGTSVSPLGIAVKIMMSVDDEADMTHISGCGYSLPLDAALASPYPTSCPTSARDQQNTSSSSTTTPNAFTPPPPPPLYSVVVAGGIDRFNVSVGAAADASASVSGGVDGDNMDYDNDPENEMDDSEYSDDAHSNFSDLASTQAGGASPTGSPAPGGDDDRNTSATDTATAIDLRNESTTPSPSRKAGFLRQQQHKDFVQQQQQHLQELRTLQQTYQQDHTNLNNNKNSNSKRNGNGGLIGVGEENSNKDHEEAISSPHRDGGRLFALKGGKQHVVAQTREGSLLIGSGLEIITTNNQEDISKSSATAAISRRLLSVSPLSLPYDTIAAAALQKYHNIHLLPSLLASLQLLHDDAASRAFSSLRATAPPTTTPTQMHMKMKNILQSIPTGEFKIVEPSSSPHLPCVLVSVLLSMTPRDVAIEGFVCLPWATIVTVSVRIKETRRVSHVDHASTLQQVAAAERSAALAAATLAASSKKKGGKAAPPAAAPILNPSLAKKASLMPPPAPQITETTTTSAKVTITVIINNTSNS